MVGDDNGETAVLYCDVSVQELMLLGFLEIWAPSDLDIIRWMPLLDMMGTKRMHHMVHNAN